MRSVTVYLSMLEYARYNGGGEATGATAADKRVPSRAMQLQVPIEDIVSITPSTESDVGYIIRIRRVDL